MEKRIWLYLGSIIGFAFTIAVCLQLYTAYKFNTLFDAAAAGNTAAVKSTAVQILFSFLVAGILCPLFSYGADYCIQKSMARVRMIIFKKIEDLPMDYFDNNHSGEIMSCLNSDLNALESAYFWPVLMTMIAVIMGIGSVFMLLFINVYIALFTILMGLISSYVNSLFVRPVRGVSDSIQQQSAAVSEGMVDLLWGFNVIKIFNIGRIMADRFNKKNRQLANAFIKYFKITSVMEGTNYLLGNLTSLGVIVLGAILISKAGLSIGSAIACTQLFGGVSFMFIQLGGFSTQMQRSLAGASRVFRLLDEQEETSRNEAPEHLTGDMVTLEDVSFSYSDKKVLDRLSFSVPHGKTAALVGPSGCGKSTVLKLLLGFYQHEQGKILVDGRPLGSYSLEELRSLIAYVPQDAYLFQGTIEENIRMGNEKASRDDVIAAARFAYAHDFIMELPRGYDSEVGENGAKLSGGQRQRVAIARAVIRNAPILLLDEATSALDSKSEQIVQKALDSLMKNRTTIVIAHRLSTITNADVIFVMENGKVIEKGMHMELLEKRGVYSRFYDMQFS